jgi:glycosyltransferase involved in cell wall biosynthesis
VRFPKFIDTQVFRPGPEVPKEWDILVVGRLISRYKNYAVLAALSQRFRTAVCGDGPEAARLQSLYPQVNWLGYIPNHELPHYYNRAHLFMHTSFRDFYPRVLAEAMACGLPCIAFKKGIAPEVLPPDCGLLVSHRDFTGPIAELLKDHPRRLQLGQQARRHALEHMGADACLKALEKLFLRLESRPAFQKRS